MRIPAKVAGAVAAAGIAVLGVTGCTPQEIQWWQNCQQSSAAETAINPATRCWATRGSGRIVTRHRVRLLGIRPLGLRPGRRLPARRLVQPDQLRLRRGLAAAR